MSYHDTRKTILEALQPDTNLNKSFNKSANTRQFEQKQSSARLVLVQDLIFTQGGMVTFKKEPLRVLRTIKEVGNDINLLKKIYVEQFKKIFRVNNDFKGCTLSCEPILVGPQPETNQEYRRQVEDLNNDITAYKRPYVEQEENLFVLNRRDKIIKFPKEPNVGDNIAYPTSRQNCTQIIVSYNSSKGILYCADVLVTLNERGFITAESQAEILNTYYAPSDIQKSDYTSPEKRRYSIDEITESPFCRGEYEYYPFPAIKNIRATRGVLLKSFQALVRDAPKILSNLSYIETINSIKSRRSQGNHPNR